MLSLVVETYKQPFTPFLFKERVLSIMEEEEESRIVNQMTVQGVPCIVDVGDFRSLGYWVTNFVSEPFFYQYKLFQETC